MNFQNNIFEEMAQFMQKHEEMLENLTRLLSKLPLSSQQRIIKMATQIRRPST